ncbi:hypothetical protein ACGC1H_000034 [Rhizoctonia solani]
MGKCTQPVESLSPGKPSAALTVLAAVTAFLGLLVMSLSSMSNGLAKGIQRSVGITRESKRLALVGFGYMVNQLVSALQSNQAAQVDAVRSLNELQKVDVMDTISPSVPLTNSEGYLSHILRFLLPNEDYVSQTRQHFNQVRLLSQCAALTVFFWKVPHPSPSMAGTDASEPSPAQFFDPSHSSKPLTHIHLPLQERRTFRAVAQASGTFLLSQIELQASPLHTRRAGSRRTAGGVAQAGSSNTKAGEINATHNAKCPRHSTQPFCSLIEADRSSICASQGRKDS